MTSWFYDPWVLGVGTVLAATAIIALSKWGRTVLSRPWQRIRARSGSVPTKTIMVLPQSNGLWWHMGRRLGKEAMQVVADLYASNLTGDPLHLLETYIAKLEFFDQFEALFKAGFFRDAVMACQYIFKCDAELWRQRQRRMPVSWQAHCRYHGYGKKPEIRAMAAICGRRCTYRVGGTAGN